MHWIEIFIVKSGMWNVNYGCDWSLVFCVYVCGFMWVLLKLREKVRFLWFFFCSICSKRIVHCVKYMYVNQGLKGGKNSLLKTVLPFFYSVRFIHFFSSSFRLALNLFKFSAIFIIIELEFMWVFWFIWFSVKMSKLVLNQFLGRHIGISYATIIILCYDYIRL